MQRRVISRDIREFLERYIFSVSMLEALLLLHKTPREVWTISDLAERLYLPHHVAERVIVQLCDTGFCEPVAPSVEAYRYVPGPHGRRLLIDRLAATHEKNLIGLTNLIHHLPGDQGPQRHHGRLFRRREDEQRFC